MKDLAYYGPGIWFVMLLESKDRMSTGIWK